MKNILSFPRLIKETYQIYTHNEMSVYAGYATLYILMAMVPLLSLVIGVLNMLPDVSLQLFESIIRKLIPNLPELQNMIHSVIANVDRQAGRLAVSISLVVSLWSASNGVNALQMGLCKISGTGGSFLQKRFSAMMYTLLFIALIPALLIFKVLRGAIVELIAAVNRLLSIPDIAGRLLSFMEYSGIITTAAMVVVILLAYTYLQGRHRKLRYQLPGAVFAVIMCLMFSFLFEFFIQRFWQASSLYGSLASILLSAMWLKSIVVILFYGAALNEAINRRRILSDTV